MMEVLGFEVSSLIILSKTSAVEYIESDNNIFTFLGDQSNLSTFLVG